TDHAQDVVEHGILTNRADDTEWYAKSNREKQRQPGELCRHRNAREDLVKRRLLGDISVTQITVGETAEPIEILDDDRLIQAQFAFELVLLGLTDHAGGIEQDICDIARHDPQNDEDDHRDPEQCQDHQQQAPYQIAAQGPAPSDVTWAVRRRLNAVPGGEW